jgi:hypothetical protein
MECELIFSVLGCCSLYALYNVEIHDCIVISMCMHMWMSASVHIQYVGL